MFYEGVSMLKRLIVAIAICTTFLAASAWSQGKGQGKAKGHDQGDSEIVFSAHDRETIGRYFSDQQSNLPPGLAKRNGNLPPGLQKQLKRNGTLPPGLQKRLQYFPPELDRQLPPLPDIYRRATIGRVAVIIDQRTQRIADVIHDVLSPWQTP
jgi:hypothetical protein